MSQKYIVCMILLHCVSVTKEIILLLFKMFPYASLLYCRLGSSLSRTLFFNQYQLMPVQSSIPNSITSSKHFTVKQKAFFPFLCYYKTENCGVVLILESIQYIMNYC